MAFNVEVHGSDHRLITEEWIDQEEGIPLLDQALDDLTNLREAALNAADTAETAAALEEIESLKEAVELKLFQRRSED
jgi:hypothetical protein